MIITIDGPSGTGKTTIARLVAQKLNYIYCDTGSMYRTVALAITNFCCDYSDEQISELLNQPTISFTLDQKNGLNCFIGNELQTNQIRTQEISDLSSQLSKKHIIRTFLRHIQRSFSEGNNVIFEGRDQGSVVFPNADHKFFLTADINTRSERRQKDLLSMGEPTSIQDVKHTLSVRDHHDSSREIDPLICPKDAHIIDTSNITIDEVISEIIRIINNE